MTVVQEEKPLEFSLILSVGYIFVWNCRECGQRTKLACRDILQPKSHVVCGEHETGEEWLCSLGSRSSLCIKALGMIAVRSVGPQKTWPFCLVPLAKESLRRGSQTKIDRIRDRQGGNDGRGQVCR